jgi:hypothetical protein
MLAKSILSPAVEAGRTYYSHQNIMTDTKSALTKSDLEHVERIVYNTADDMAVSIARSFERMEERIDAMDARLYNRIADLEDALKVAEEKASVSQ